MVVIRKRPMQKTACNVDCPGEGGAGDKEPQDTYLLPNESSGKTHVVLV